MRVDCLEVVGVARTETGRCILNNDSLTDRVVLPRSQAFIACSMKSRVIKAWGGLGMLRVVKGLVFQHNNMAGVPFRCNWCRSETCHDEEHV